MGFVRQLLLVGAYFLLLSTTLQSEDAYVFFYDSEYGQQDNQNAISRFRQLIIFSIFVLLFYITVLITPYLKFHIRKLAIGSCVILLGKYACELATYTNIMINVFQLAAIFLDIIGTAVFYLSSIRALQILCQKYENTEQSGKIFGVAAAMFGLSVIFGYAIAYGCYRSIPLWTYIIILTCMTILSGAICFFAFPLQRRSGPANQLQQQRQQPQRNDPASQNPAQPQANNGQSSLEQVYRDNMTLGQVLKSTWFMYKKMFIIIPIQMNLGFFISYSNHLLEYLVWTTQSESQSLRLLHNLDVILIFGGAAIVASLIFGILSDMFSVKRVGYAVTILTVFTMGFLYIAILSKTFPATMMLFVFVGLSIFGLGVWLLCVSSKVFGGKFQAFAVNAQFIGLASSMYQVAVILFSGRIDIQFKLCFQLATLILSTLVCIFLIRKLPQGQIDILFEQSQMDESQVTQRRPQPEREIEMVQNSKNAKKIEQELETKDNQKSVDPDLLL